MNLLSPHGRVLALLGREPSSRVIDVARHLDVTESNAWHLIDDLVKAGIVTRIKGGRQNIYEIARDMVVTGELTFTVAAFLDVCATGVATGDNVPDHQTVH